VSSRQRSRATVAMSGSAVQLTCGSASFVTLQPSKNVDLGRAAGYHYLCDRRRVPTLMSFWTVRGPTSSTFTRLRAASTSSRSTRSAASDPSTSSGTTSSASTSSSASGSTPPSSATSLPAPHPALRGQAGAGLAQLPLPGLVPPGLAGCSSVGVERDEAQEMRLLGDPDATGKA